MPVDFAVALITCRDPIFKNDQVCLIERAMVSTDPWSGHLAFPGGRRRGEDRDLLATAIRETREETGILLLSSDLVHPLRRESAGHTWQRPVVVQPYWFHLALRPPVRPDTTEVHQILWIPLAHLLNPRAIAYRPMDTRDPSRLWPGIPLCRLFLWGFTYRVLLRFLKETWK